ncbi:gamma-glutamyltransferase [Desulfonema ishimotonii]|uniref:Gamma-glutamyltransferase n=1 Tax=Desulfonema ishimotonii TaxID=45657 RepID=A0A401FY30_9BACT|nr:gamma-glutamyltransferase [Desulfonema ishimotonii]GBC61843.1 gamma-glutamyltransferase [Desulfonema ishimotonii]
MTSEHPPWPQKLSVSKHGMIATQQADATQAGLEILGAGGNAIDAAVAAAFALGVCEPHASGLGGQTMMMIHTAEPRRTFAVDGSSRAPSRATIERVPKTAMRLRGHRATTVPSTPAVLGYILAQYGSLPLSRVLEPAIRLAETGYRITALQRRLQKREKKHWADGNAARFFLKEGREPYKTGEMFRQPVLARTLSILARKGIEEFYQGQMAAQIAEDMARNDGFIRKDDLALIPHPIERRPVSCRFGGWRVMTFPPPGAGRTLVEMLNIISQFDPGDYDPLKLKGLLLLCEVIRRAQLDRGDRPFEPNFYPQVQDRRMLTVDYARLVARQIRSRLRTRGNTGGETTHLSVMDNQGNVVALTQSVERVYGSFVVHPDLGFLYNNYMSAFEYEDITHPYYLRPNGVPWASVAPTIIFRGKRPYIAIGSPGSERIASSVLQVLLRIAGGQAPLDAVSAPRIHCTVGGEVHLEASRIRNDLPEFLRRRGFEIVEKEPFAFYMGCVQMVMREGKELAGVADPRRDGSAAGPTVPVRSAASRQDTPDVPGKQDFET